MDLNYRNFDDVMIEMGYVCPITNEVFLLPMTIAQQGAQVYPLNENGLISEIEKNNTFEFSAIQEWTIVGGTHPSTRQEISVEDCYENIALMKEIKAFVISIQNYFPEEAKKYLDAVALLEITMAADKNANQTFMDDAVFVGVDEVDAVREMEEQLVAEIEDDASESNFSEVSFLTESDDDSYIQGFDNLDEDLLDTNQEEFALIENDPLNTESKIDETVEMDIKNITASLDLNSNNPNAFESENKDIIKEIDDISLIENETVSAESKIDENVKMDIENVTASLDLNSNNPNAFESESKDIIKEIVDISHVDNEILSADSKIEVENEEVEQMNVEAGSLDLNVNNPDGIQSEEPDQFVNLVENTFSPLLSFANGIITRVMETAQEQARLQEEQRRQEEARVQAIIEISNLANALPNLPFFNHQRMAMNMMRAQLQQQNARDIHVQTSNDNPLNNIVENSVNDVFKFLFRR